MNLNKYWTSANIMHRSHKNIVNLKKDIMDLQKNIMDLKKNIMDLSRKYEGPQKKDERQKYDGPRRTVYDCVMMYRTRASVATLL